MLRETWGQCYQTIIVQCSDFNEKIYPILPYLLSQSWNAGKGDCGHYHSQLGFGITDTGAVRGSLQKGGTGFIQDGGGGGYSKEDPGRPRAYKNNTTKLRTKNCEKN